MSTRAMIFVKDARKEEFALYVHGDGYPDKKGLGEPLRTMIYAAPRLDDNRPDKERDWIPPECRFLFESANINTDAGRFTAATAAVLLNRGFHVYLERPENIHGDIEYFYRITLPKKHEDVAQIHVENCEGKEFDIYNLKGEKSNERTAH